MTRGKAYLWEMELRIAVDAHDYCDKVSEANTHHFHMLNLNVDAGLALISARITTKSSYLKTPCR